MRNIFIFAIVLLAFINPAVAQIVPYCGQLSEADCTLMCAGQQSLIAMRSATLNRAVFTIASAWDELHLEIGVRGPITNLPEVRTHERLFLGRLRAEVTLSFDLSDSGPEWQDLVAFESVDVRLIDGILYVNLDSLEPPPIDPLLHGWVSYDLKLQDPGVFGDTPPTPNPGIRVHEFPLNGTDLERMVAAFDPSVLKDFVTVVRDGDTFETRMDFPTMYANTAVREVLHEQLPDIWWRFSPNTRGPVSDEDLDRLVAAVSEFYPEPVVLYGWSVDPVTRLAQAFHYWVPWDFNRMVEAAVFPNDRQQASQMQFILDAEFSDYNAPVEIALPPDAQPLTPNIFVLLFPGVAARMGIDSNGEQL